MKLLKVILGFVYIVVVIILLRSVILSGVNFTFNPDELFNANTVYLMVKGFRPYVDFYTVYSPILHWIITPVFLLFGFTFKAVSVTRFVMAGLFMIRLVLMFFLVKKVFNARVALLFVPLFLLDPFMVFVGMQVRPENLSMVFYTGFLLVFSIAYSYHKKQSSKAKLMFFLSGILCGTAILINIKIVPSLLAFGIVFITYAFQKKQFFQLLLVVNGFCLTFLFFFSYFLIQGYLPAMFLHVFLDPMKLNNAIPYPTWLGYFYFSNQTIYGMGGKPINWLFAWLLPVFAFAAGYKTFSQSIEKSDGLEMIKIILFFSLIVQWVSMLFINSVFIQYYIPLNWLYALFTAVLLDDILFEIQLNKIIKMSAIGLSFIFFTMLYTTSIKANLNRSGWRWDPYLDEFTKVWKMIPAQAPAFPNVVFRRPIYPVLWGSTFATYMRDRYPPAYKMIEKYQLPILTFLNDEFLSYLDKDTQDYITKHYKRDSEDPLIWRRF